MTEEATIDLATETKDRAILPVLIPLVAILITEVVAFSLSRVLITSGELGAVVVATIIALGVLFGAAVIAARPRIKSQTIVALVVVMLVAVVAAGGYAYQRELDDSGGAGHTADPEAAHTAETDAAH